MAHSKIETHTPDTLHIALAEAWLVVECVPERLDLKRQILSRLGELAPKGTIIASNSSSYSISEIIHGLELSNEHRLLSAHSYWPPETSVIEIMGHDTTDPACISFMLYASRLHGFEPYHVKRESMGYIYNRIWAAIKREALLVAAEGVAEPAEIDAVFKGVLKTAKGPFEQMDVVGLDVVMDIEEHYAAKREDVGRTESSRKAREFLKATIRSGRLGVKSSRGFYSYDADGRRVEVTDQPFTASGQNGCPADVIELGRQTSRTEHQCQKGGEQGPECMSTVRHCAASEI